MLRLFSLALSFSVLFFNCPASFAEDSLSPFRKAQTAENREIVCRLARQAVETKLKDDRVLAPPPGLPDFLGRPSGAFVTIVKGKKVVGCMGTLQPREADLKREIIRSALLAASNDPWHNPIAVGELSGLKYIISIPGPLRRAKSSADLDPANLGLLVRSGNRSALLLPGEALTPQWQVYECKRKAGIPQNERVEMFVFETVPFGPW